MKVYELMNELSTLPAGATVRIHLLRELSEMVDFEDDTELKQTTCGVDSVDLITDDIVQLSD